MTFEEIKQQAEQTQNKRYYRSNILNQNRGLTDFIIELEKHAKEKNIYFDIVGGSPHVVIPYKNKNIILYNKENNTIKKSEINTHFYNKKEVLFTNYISFIYDNFYYYIELNENPFFNNYISKIKLLKDESEFYYKNNYYLQNIKSDKIYKNIDDLYTLNDNARKTIKENLFKIFYNCIESAEYIDKRQPQNAKHYINKEKKIYFNI